MAHFAKVDENNKVLNVVVVDNSEAPDEATGIAFCENTLGPGTYLQTSYNTFEKKHYTDGELSADQSKAFRGNYAQIDGYYLPDENHFQPVQPFPSWTPPVAKPETDAEAGTYWDWDEDAQNWVQIHIVID